MIEDKIPIQIKGQTYEIVGNPTDALYYHSLAQYVEQHMKEIEQKTNVISSMKLAVLAALNITDELFREREKKSHSSQSFDKKHDELIGMLDEMLTVKKEHREEVAAKSEGQLFDPNFPVGREHRDGEDAGFYDAKKFKHAGGHVRTFL